MELREDEGSTLLDEWPEEGRTMTIAIESASPDPSKGDLSMPEKAIRERYTVTGEDAQLNPTLGIGTSFYFNIEDMPLVVLASDYDDLLAQNDALRGLLERIVPEVNACMGTYGSDWADDFGALYTMLEQADAILAPKPNEVQK